MAYANRSCHFNDDEGEGRANEEEKLFFCGWQPAVVVPGKVTITNRQHDNVNKEVIATHNYKKETVTRQISTNRQKRQ